MPPIKVEDMVSVSYFTVDARNDEITATTLLDDKAFEKLKNESSYYLSFFDMIGHTVDVDLKVVLNALIYKVQQLDKENKELRKLINKVKKGSK